MRWSRIDLGLARLVGVIFAPWQRRHVKRAELTAAETKPLTLLTGATGGIGEVTAQRLARAGHNLLLTGRDEARLLALAEEVRGMSDGSIMTLALDLGEPDAAALIDEVLAAGGFHVEVLINNAGLAERNSFLGSDPALIGRVMDINIRVLTEMMRHYLPLMVSRGSGAVVNISSIGGLAPGPYQAVYYASKAYVTSLTEAVAHEVRGKGVYVGAVLPGPTKSAFHEKANGLGSYYLTLFGQMRADRVALTIERLLLSRHWPVVTPGPFYTIVGFFMRVIPGSLLTPLMGFLYKQR